MIIIHKKPNRNNSRWSNINFLRNCVLRYQQIGATVESLESLWIQQQCRQRNDKHLIKVVADWS